MIDLTRDGASVELDMPEISGGAATTRSRCRLSRRGDELEIMVDAADPNMLALIASAPIPGVKDAFLYEEDCVQIATASQGSAEIEGFLLVNPMLCRRGNAVGDTWSATTRRHENGWRVAVTVALAGRDVVGLLVSRFFRGVHHEVHGLTRAHPHPLVPGDFAAVVLAGEPAVNAPAFEASFVAAARDAELRAISATRLQIDTALSKPGRPRVSLETAQRLARVRIELAVENRMSFLCWNEAYFLRALMDLYSLDADAGWIDHAVRRAGQVLAMRGDVIGREDRLWGMVLPTWYDAPGETGDHAATLGTGVILAPIASLIRLVMRDPSLTHHREAARAWVPACRRAIDCHDPEWLDLPGGSGNYIEPYQKGPKRIYPGGGSRICPLNRSFALAMPMLDLGVLDNDRRYLERVARMARFFRDSIDITPDGTLEWEYLASRYKADGEDISHAHCQVMFAQACATEGVEFNERDLRGIAATLAMRVFRHGDVPCETVRGHAPGFRWYVGPWASLTRFAPQVLPRMIALVEAAMAEATFDFEKEAWGLRNITSLELARRSLQNR